MIEVISRNILTQHLSLLLVVNLSVQQEHTVSLKIHHQEFLNHSLSFPNTEYLFNYDTKINNNRTEK